MEQCTEEAREKKFHFKQIYIKQQTLACKVKNLSSKVKTSSWKNMRTSWRQSRISCYPKLESWVLKTSYTGSKFYLTFHSFLIYCTSSDEHSLVEKLRWCRKIKVWSHRLKVEQAVIGIISGSVRLFVGSHSTSENSRI